VYFCIRDDDTSFFTSPEELDKAYGEITQWGPVSLAVVPFHRAGTSKGVPESFRRQWSIHPLHENGSLVEYLRCKVAQGRFEIMLHGYHHDERDGRGEFATGNDLARKALEGRRYLEDLLRTKIRVFVAPRNEIGREGLRAICEAGLHFSGFAGVRHGWPLLSPRTWLLWFRLHRLELIGQPGVPWVLDLKDHREITGNAVTPVASFSVNEAAFDHAIRADGVFCAATHYWELRVPSMIAGDPPVGEHLGRLIERARTDHRVMWRTVGDVVTDEHALM
jgi:hypothetical protein